MKPKRRKGSQRVGLPPGTIVFTGNQMVEKISIHYLQYNINLINEQVLDNHKEINFDDVADDQINWYDIRGLHDTQLLETIGKAYQIHPLILEDIADINQRPKFEDYDKGLFFIIRALSFDNENLRFKTEQVAIYFRKNLILTFQETESDLFTLVRKRIHASKGRIRDRGSDYLVYALVDVLVDQYFIVMDEFEQVMENLEDDLSTDSDKLIRDRIHHLRKGLLFARKNLTPLREAISRFSKTDNEIIEERTTLYIRDLYDHAIQVMDKMENYRDILNGLQDLHLSEISYRMNKIMQVLTIITTIFVPLSFLAGLYGMNFDVMPELHIDHAYYVLLGVMFTLAIFSLYWFRKKRWL